MNNSKAIAACYHPTTVFFIDDNRKYLSGLSIGLDDTKFSSKFYYNPMEALQYLQEKYHVDPFITRCLSHPEESRLDHRNLEIDIGAIRKEVYNPKRFEEISVIVVDYAMPSLNGLDLCLQVKHAPYKKIMLTGEAEEGIAIQAFNDGIIDKFIRKDVENFSEVINSAIEELQKQYFADLSRVIIDSLTKNPEHPTTAWLDEPEFLQLFDKINKENEFTEYYLTDAFGSFLLLDYEGNPSWLAVKSEDEMQSALEVAEGSDDPFPNDILTAMKKRERLLYLFPKGGLSDDIEEAKKSLHPATKLKGRRTNFYYSFVNDSNAYHFDSNEIMSFKAYQALLKKSKKEEEEKEGKAGA